MPTKPLSPQQVFATGFAPCLLAVVAVTQMATAIQTNLSPWKGGGFGMFADIQQPSNRSVLAWVRIDGKAYPISIPSWLDRQKKAVQAMPTKANLLALAEKLATLDWNPNSSRVSQDAGGPSPSAATSSKDTSENVLVAATFEVRYSAGPTPESREIQSEQLCRVILKLDQGARAQ